MDKSNYQNSSYKVGLIGAGRMGMSMIKHLCRANFDVMVCEVDQRKHENISHLGAQVLDLKELACRAEFVLICVGFDAQVQELLNSNSILIKYLQKDAIIAILSTMRPNSMLKIAHDCRNTPVHIVDATVCRGGRAADTGELLTFIGAELEIFERLKPVVKAYSSDVFHSGLIGTAQVAKAANNLIMWACLIANHEGLALAKRYGINVDLLRQALLGSTAANEPLKNWGDQSMSWADDDMEIVSDMAKEMNITLPQSDLVREICRSLKPKRYDLENYGT